MLKIFVISFFFTGYVSAYAGNELALIFEYSSMSEVGKERLKKEALEWTLDYYVDYVSSSKTTTSGQKSVCIKFNDEAKALYWFEIVRGTHDDSPNSYGQNAGKIYLKRSCPTPTTLSAPESKLFLNFDITSMSEKGKSRLKGETLEWIRDNHVEYVTGNKSYSRGAPSICIKFNNQEKAQYWYEMVKGTHENSPGSYLNDEKSISLNSFCPFG